MEDKKYLDKVVDYMVRSTEIDYEMGVVYLPIYQSHLPYSPPLSISFLETSPPWWSLSFYISSSFSEYCKNTFGITKDEIEYVWNGYKDNIEDKIEN